MRNRFRTVRHQVSILTVCALLVVPYHTWAQIRTWHGQNGVNIEAELVSVNDDATTVTLRTADGQLKQGSVSRLLEGDRWFIAEFEKAQRKTKTQLLNRYLERREVFLQLTFTPPANVTLGASPIEDVLERTAKSLLDAGIDIYVDKALLQVDVDLRARSFAQLNTNNASPDYITYKKSEVAARRAAIDQMTFTPTNVDRFRGYFFQEYFNGDWHSPDDLFKMVNHIHVAAAERCKDMLTLQYTIREWVKNPTYYPMDPAGHAETNSVARVGGGVSPIIQLKCLLGDKELWNKLFEPVHPWTTRTGGDIGPGPALKLFFKGVTLEGLPRMGDVSKEDSAMLTGTTSPSESVVSEKGVTPVLERTNPRRSWNEDWEPFVSTIEPYFARVTVPRADSPFLKGAVAWSAGGKEIEELGELVEGKVVTWTGRVKEVTRRNGQVTVLLDMPPHRIPVSEGEPAVLTSLRLSSTKEQEAGWRVVAPGHTVRFRTTLRKHTSSSAVNLCCGLSGEFRGQRWIAVETDGAECIQDQANGKPGPSSMPSLNKEIRQDHIGTQQGGEQFVPHWQLIQEGGRSERRWVASPESNQHTGNTVLSKGMSPNEVLSPTVLGRLLPSFSRTAQGLNPVRIRNPNDFVVVAGIRSGDFGKNIEVPAQEMATAYVSDGRFDIFFVYSDKTNALFQGDSFSLNGNGVEIQIVKVVNGNYGIRQVK